MWQRGEVNLVPMEPAPSGSGLTPLQHPWAQGYFYKASGKLTEGIGTCQDPTQPTASELIRPSPGETEAQSGMAISPKSQSKLEAEGEQLF